MVFVPMSKDNAIANYGSSWAVDHENRQVIECLGDMRPAFYFGAMYGTVERAYVEEEREHPEVRSYDVRPLPLKIRVPIRVPIPRGTQTRDGLPPGRAWILHTSDILSHGVKLEVLPITRVGFRKAPTSLEDRCDVVASWVWMEEEDERGAAVRTLRVSVDYDDDGRIFSEPDTSIRSSSGLFERLPTATVFFSEAEAVEAADRFAIQLIKAADWRRHSGRETSPAKEAA